MEQIPDIFNKEKRGEKLREAFGLSWEDLEGKKVLDVGANFGEFIEAAHRRGIEAYALDLVLPADEFEFRKEKGLAEGELKHNLPANYIVGDMHVLPIADETFDYVVAHAAGPVMTPRVEDKVHVTEEMLRVTREGGSVVITCLPMRDENFDDMTLSPNQKITRKVLEEKFPYAKWEDYNGGLSRARIIK